MAVAGSGGVRARDRTGMLIQLAAIGHAAVGARLYREELRAIVNEGCLGAVPYRGSRATAFWFLMSAPAWWLIGRLVSAAEDGQEETVLRVARSTSLATATVGVICVPVSGFWALLLISLRSISRAPRIRS